MDPLNQWKGDYSGQGSQPIENKDHFSDHFKGCCATNPISSIHGSLVNGFSEEATLHPVDFIRRSGHSRSRKLWEFTVGSTFNGGLQVIYNVFALIGNLFKSLTFALTGLCCSKAHCTIVKEGLKSSLTNIKEIFRNSLRAVPFGGHFLGKAFHELNQCSIHSNQAKQRRDTVSIQKFLDDSGAFNVKESDYLLDCSGSTYDTACLYNDSDTE